MEVAMPHRDATVGNLDGFVDPNQLDIDSGEGGDVFVPEGAPVVGYDADDLAPHGEYIPGAPSGTDYALRQRFDRLGSRRGR
jgi:hypothetical protein